MKQLSPAAICLVLMAVSLRALAAPEHCPLVDTALVPADVANAPYSFQFLAREFTYRLDANRLEILRDGSASPIYTREITPAGLQLTLSSSKNSVSLVDAGGAPVADTSFANPEYTLTVDAAGGSKLTNESGDLVWSGRAKVKVNDEPSNRPLSTDTGSAADAGAADSFGPFTLLTSVHDKATQMQLIDVSGTVIWHVDKADPGGLRVVYNGRTAVLGLPQPSIPSGTQAVITVAAQPVRAKVYDSAGRMVTALEAYRYTIGKRMILGSFNAAYPGYLKSDEIVPETLLPTTISGSVTVHDYDSAGKLIATEEQTLKRKSANVIGPGLVAVGQTVTRTVYSPDGQLQLDATVERDTAWPLAVIRGQIPID